MLLLGLIGEGGGGKVRSAEGGGDLLKENNLQSGSVVERQGTGDRQNTFCKYTEYTESK